MKVIKDGGPAFPSRSSMEKTSVGYYVNGEGGMSLRHYFAAQAMVGLLANRTPVVPGTVAESDVLKEMAKVAYAVADAMLEAGE